MGLSGPFPGLILSEGTPAHRGLSAVLVLSALCVGCQQEPAKPPTQASPPAAFRVSVDSIEAASAIYWVGAEGEPDCRWDVAHCEGDPDVGWACYFDSQLIAGAGAARLLFGDADEACGANHWSGSSGVATGEASNGVATGEASNGVTTGEASSCPWPVEYINARALTGQGLEPDFVPVGEAERVAVESLELRWHRPDTSDGDPIDAQGEAVTSAWVTFEESRSGMVFGGWIVDGIFADSPEGVPLSESCVIFPDQTECALPQDVDLEVRVYLGPEDESLTLVSGEMWRASRDGTTLRVTCEDQDNDGYCASFSDDCDDENPQVHRASSEVCNGVDDDCDGEIDEGLSSTNYYADGDGDGFGEESDAVQACSPPSGRVAVAGDCDDTDGNVYPGADEVCDGKDNDCDGKPMSCFGGANWGSKENVRSWWN